MFENLTDGIVPAYFVDDAHGNSVPVIISLFFRDQHGRVRIPPTTENSINRTVEITKRDAAATARIFESEPIADVARKYIQRSFTLTNPIVILLCQNENVATQVMECLYTSYTIRLVKN